MQNTLLKIAPLERGERNANKAASIWWGFKWTCASDNVWTNFSIVSEEHLLNTVLKYDSYMEEETVSFTEPLACCIRCVKRMKIEYGSNILIIGLGTIGLLMGQAARELGFKAYGVDLIEERVELAKKLGFENAFKLTTNEEQEKLEMKAE